MNSTILFKKGKKMTRLEKAKKLLALVKKESFSILADCKDSAYGSLILFGIAIETRGGPEERYDSFLQRTVQRHPGIYIWLEPGSCFVLEKEECPVFNELSTTIRNEIKKRCGENLGVYFGKRLR